jgi:hypothetical protein
MAIKLLNPETRFKLICEYDDALVAESQEEQAALDSGLKDKNGEPIMAPTRYRQYIDNLDESKLKFREGAKPSRFHFRCLTSQELAELDERYFELDEKIGIRVLKAGRAAFFIEVFRLGVIGIEDENGQVAPIGPNEIGAAVVNSVGSVINFYTQLGKNAKTPAAK